MIDNNDMNELKKRNTRREKRLDCHEVFAQNQQTHNQHIKARNETTTTNIHKIKN